MTALVPCPGCNRHVKSDDTTCPFCQAAVASAPCSGRCARPSVPRLASAALVAAGAALLGAACETSHSSVVPYGIPPHVDAGTQSQPDGGTKTDAETDAPADAARDALPDAKK
jgi:hypothetical protein